MISTLWPLKRYIVLEQTDGTTLPSKRVQREEYWYPELCNVYPYGLNDNVRGAGNVLKSDERLIVYIIIVNPWRASQRGLQYLVCHCLVCLSAHAILAVRATKSITKDTIVLSVRFAAILKWRFS